jgi:tetratricopeptide (TPR) repeat protein
MFRRPSLSLALAVFAAFAAAPALGQGIGRGFELERAGRYADAAQAYAQVLRVEPANLPALLGLERALDRLSRVADVLAPARRALAIDSANPAILDILIRTFVAVDEADSAAALVARWSARSPSDESPFREWIVSLEDRGRFDDARAAIALGRRMLGRPSALAIESAELEQRQENWEGAAREWTRALAAEPAQEPSALAQLEDTPADARGKVTDALTGADAPRAARRAGAELLLGWGEAARAWTVFQTTVGPDVPDAPYALHRFAERALGVGTPAARRVRAYALARFAEVLPARVALQARVEAARALLDVGDGAAARAILAPAAADSTAAPAARALAHTVLVYALLEAGQLDSAAAELARLRDDLPLEEHEQLYLGLARARIARGELAAADSLLAGDSSVAAVSLAGWVALYRGDVKGAMDRFREAGPYAGDRAEATERTIMAALLDRIARDTFPELGAALLRLAQGDSVAAAAALQRAAGQLPERGGRLDVLLLAGQAAVGTAAGEKGAADIFAEIVRTGPPAGAAAPAAELAWAQLLVRQNRLADAVSHLEHLILTYPQSAVVPEARRLLDRAKGAVPRS